MFLLNLQSVHKTHGEGIQRTNALNDVSLSIKPGEFIAIHGPSGSGKTSLCNILALIDRPSSGAVIFFGIDVNHRNDLYLSKLRGERIGLIFQDFNLIPVLTALENILLPLQFQGKLHPGMRSEALSLLRKLGLKDEVHRKPRELSGGQQQRVAIARALIKEPSIIIADEPTASLDTLNALAIIELMHSYNQVHGMTFVFSTHDDRLLDRADRRIHLTDGRIVCDTRRELLS